jgi:hypothetical protein
VDKSIFKHKAARAVKYRKHRAFIKDVYKRVMHGLQPFIDEHSKQYEHLVKVEQDPNDPTQINIQIPCQVIWPVEINVFSSLFSYLIKR